MTSIGRNPPVHKPGGRYNRNGLFEQIILETRRYNSQGCEELEKLSNFTARIEQDIQRDNGQEIEREFRIAAEIEGRSLPLARACHKDGQVESDRIVLKDKKISSHFDESVK